MQILLSPAKKQDFDTRDYPIRATQPSFKSDITALVGSLRTLPQKKLQTLMSLSDKLAELNYQRYQDFNTNSYTKDNAKPAVYALQGDAYQGLFIKDFDANELNYLQQHLVILSGLYGLLRPMDLIQPYRLEMKTKLPCGNSADLYAYWQHKLTQALNKKINQSNSEFVLNLASNEYYKAINHKQLVAPVITAQFKQQRSSEFKMIGIYAKRARGLMTRFLAKHQLGALDDIKQFDLESYRFNRKLSSDSIFVFTRPD